MRRLLTLAILAAVAVPAVAQEPPRPPRPPRDTMSVSPPYGYEFGPEGIQIFTSRRGRLGVVVDLGTDPARDSIGARITAVTPGGPADKAGVQTGDIVVQLNSTRLAGPSDVNSEEDVASRPGRRLVELASRLHTGDTVHLELRRDGKPLNVTLVAGESGMESIVTRDLRLQPSRAPLMVQPFGGEGMNFMVTGGLLSNLELVKVNPGLAPYFGTSEGILVVDAPGDSALGLKAGDVILTIGGRKPTSPSHAFRILGTYDPGESVVFDLMRMKHRITVTGKMPERRGWRALPNSYEDFDGLLAPGWEHMDLLRGYDGWIGHELPQLLQTPRMQILKNLPQQLIRLTPQHRTVAT